MKRPPQFPQRECYSEELHDPVFERQFLRANRLQKTIDRIYQTETETRPLSKKEKVAYGLLGLGVVGLTIGIFVNQVETAGQEMSSTPYYSLGGQAVAVCLANNDNYIELPVSLPTSSLPTTSQIVDSTAQWVPGARSCSAYDYVQLLTAHNHGLSILPGANGLPDRVQVSSLPEEKSQVMMWLPVAGVHST